MFLVCDVICIDAVICWHKFEDSWFSSFLWGTTWRKHVFSCRWMCQVFAVFFFPHPGRVFLGWGWVGWGGMLTFIPTCFMNLMLRHGWKTQALARPRPSETLFFSQAASDDSAACLSPPLPSKLVCRKDEAKNPWKLRKRISLPNHVSSITPGIERHHDSKMNETFEHRIPY